MASASGSRYLAASPTVPAGTWICSKDSRSMDTDSSPCAYRYCMVRLSTVAVSTFVPALKVLSTTVPESTFFSVVRTNAPPLPGLTCWNSTTDQSSPSRLRTNPFLRSFVVAMSCPASGFARWTWQVYRRGDRSPHRRPVHRYDTPTMPKRHQCLEACQREDPRPAALSGYGAGRGDRAGTGRVDVRSAASIGALLLIPERPAQLRAARGRYGLRGRRVDHPDRRVAARTRPGRR